MQIHISREGQQFGPYTLEQIHEYLKTGQILLTDLLAGLLSIEDKGDRQFVDRLMQLWKAARKSSGENREANPGPNQKTTIERKPGVAK